MSMKPEFFCCIGAELKDEMAGSLKSSRIFMYRAAENQTITDMLADGFFNEADDLRINDLILLYCPEEEESNAFARVSSFSGGVVKTTKLKGPSDLDFVKKTGDTMSGALKMRDYLAFQKIQGGTAIYIEQTSNALVFKQGLIYNNIQMSLGQESVSIHPYTNGGTLGKSNAKWETLYASKLNNGANLVIPNKAGTLATMGDVELAARSGTQLTDQGVWYAKMYAATVAPAADDGTNYADFSQVDGQGNPIIVTYNRVNGAWVQDQTITPPAEYDGYVIVTSKIWDIAEQTGQQGGRVLWNHTSKEFTPYPQIISFEDINVTGNSTVVMPQNPGANQIVNKDYVDNAIGSGANTDLSNLTDTGANIANWSSNVSNCITEIPQDIKLELNNGTLKLKAGSKVYIPNGVGVFDAVTIAVDKSQSSTTAAPENGPAFVFYSSTGLRLRNVSRVSSSSTAPTIGLFLGWYDTANNLMKFDSSGNVWDNGGQSFPIAIVTISNGAIASIDKIFNGFGYVGAVIFALPGVKGLIPSGKNPDGGTLNTEFSLSTVKTYEVSSSGYIVLNSTDIDVYYHNTTRYVEDINYNVDISSGATFSRCICGEVFYDTNKITSFASKDTFLAVDYSGSDFVVSFQRPTAQNNYTWYRKYKSGWVEQGGSIDSVASGTYTVTFPVTMADTHYTILKTMSTTSSNGAQYNQISFFNKTTTSAETNTAGVGFSWQVSGMAQG